MTDPSSDPSATRRWILWSLATWLALGAAGWGLSWNLKACLDFWVLSLLAPIFAIVYARRALNCSHGIWRFGRVGFWVLTLLGVAIVVLSFQGQFELLFSNNSAGFRSRSRYVNDRHFLVRSALFQVLIAVGLGLLLWRSRRKTGVTPLGWKRDFSIALILIVAVAGAGLVYAHSVATLMRNDGDKRWSDIGRPMEEFMASMAVKPTEENASLGALVKDLRPFGIRSLYRTKYGEPDPNSGMEFPSKDIEALITEKRPAGDQVIWSPERATYFAAHAEELNQLYADILSRPAPVWSNPAWHDPLNQEPNAVILRRLAQLMSMDALWRISRGDHKGAAVAVNAGLKISESLADRPSSICLMIRIAIESLFVPALARLPEEPGAWEQLATDAADYREQYKNDAQSNVCWIRSLDQVTFLEMRIESYESWRSGSLIAPIPGWLELIILRPHNAWQYLNASIMQAGSIEIISRENLLNSSDLGLREIEALNEQTPSMTYPIGSGWQRINAALLQREQAEVIRASRSQIDKASPISVHDSVVIPGAKWEILFDSAKRAFSTKLMPTPAWVAESAAFKNGQFLLPLDGTGAWVCREQ